MDINNLTVSSVAEVMYRHIEVSGPESQNIHQYYEKFGIINEDHKRLFDKFVGKANNKTLLRRVDDR